MARRRTPNFPKSTASTRSHGYGYQHTVERRRWEPIVQTGRVACVRCGLLILAGEAWHLDHADDEIHYLGPAHAKCNLRAAAKRGNERMREKKRLAWLERSPEQVQSREW